MKKLFFLLLLFSGACKQAYIPPVNSTNNTYLVVDGFINNGLDSTYINLTHTFKLDDTSSVTPELHAQLTIEGKDNSSVALTEWGNGQYGATSLALNNGIQYRLHIRTITGKEYLSDYLDVKPSPPIDSISWKRTGGGLQIYANTHDPQNASHYYRWDYLETWQFHVYYQTDYQYVNHQMISVYPDPYYTCWMFASSTSVMVGASTKLAADVISQAPLVLIPSNSWKIGIRYSILVRQYVLSTDAFNYWQALQRNSEQIGSIFSAQPSEGKGNIHNVADSSEPVIGFISAGTLQKSRIFITPDQIPNWNYPGPDPCDEFAIPPDSLDYYLGGGQNVYRPVSIGQNAVGTLRWLISNSTCVDCTLTGTNHKPSFW